MPEVISVVNQKGGVGKTTTTVNLAAGLSEIGQSVLVIDFDAQMNSTNWMLGRETEEDEASIFDSLDTVAGEEAEEFSLAELAEDSGAGFDFIPAGEDMIANTFDSTIGRSGAYPNQLRVRVEELEREFEKGLISTPNGPYDYCLVDCPPSLGRAIMVALVGSDGILVPVAADGFSMQGLKQLLNTIREVRINNSDLEIIGILANNLDLRSGLVKDMEEALHNRYEDLMFETSIPWRSKINEVTTLGTYLKDHAPSSDARSFYKSLAHEVVERTQAPTPA
ncbi:chromosome partitioning protein ParA [Salinibacter sp. 10B]|uniref:ParA family protein n=1 Tax=Salinibacter sp. 10B TaxID=1923971 RepID=UPI000CF3B803|nr:ParA family protein [Salinibacter sp. 10B]PQJ36819.1 chromosome partitioning protein ParA [Salinibacter sp. 10B]